MSTVTMSDMLKAGVHFGHRTRYWNPNMAPYIYGARDKIHIINLEHTFPMLHDAVNFAGSIAKNGGKIIFVGTKQAAQDVIAKEAARCGMPYINHRWLGGMLTNYKTVRRSVRRYIDLQKMSESGRLDKMLKKEALQLRRELEKLKRAFAGIREMGGLPDALFVIDVKNEKIAVCEANKLRIPVIGIVDTNSNPENIDYVIPGNDDSMGAIQLYATAIADAIIEAKASLSVAQEGAKEDKVAIKPTKVQDASAASAVGDE